MRAVAIAALGGLYLLGLGLVAIAVAGPLSSGDPDGSSLVIATTAYVPYAAVGSILVARRPGNAIGWVLLALGWILAFAALPVKATAHELQILTASALEQMVVWLTNWSVAVMLALLATLAFTFPTGQLPEGRWQRVASLGLVVAWGSVIALAFWPVLSVRLAGATDAIEIPNPIGLLPPTIFGIRLAPQTIAPVLVIVLMVSIGAVVGRYRVARDLERLQLRWFVAALASIAITVPAGFALLAVFPGAAIAWWPAAIAFGLPPVAVGIAVTRYRLYEIDRLISRGLSWAVLSGLLLAVYAGAVLLLQTVLGDVIQGQTVAVAGSTLLAAALFQPLRRRVQATVDHRFNRARYDAERTAATFSERMRDEVDLEATRRELLASVVEAIQPRAAAVWIRARGRTR